jgi:alkane 1-monooxygenase
MAKYLGFFGSLALPAIFWIDALSGYPVLGVGLFFICLPTLRQFCPIDFPSVLNEDELVTLAPVLSILPNVSGIIFLISVAAIPFAIDLHLLSGVQIIGLWLSFWIYASLILPAVHELIHRRSLVEVRLGRIIGASIGFITFIEEHKSHHASAGRGYDPDFAAPGESIYQFAIRTSISGFKDAVKWSWETTTKKNWPINYLWATSLIPLAFVSVYLYHNGLTGLLFFLSICVGTHFSFRAITYMQHWGLGDFASKANGFGYSWISTCIFQSWVTFNIALHDAHHIQPSRPFYLLVTTEKSPRLPMSYPMMFLLCLAPSAFEQVMNKRIKTWHDSIKSDSPIFQDEVCFSFDLLLPRS